MISDKIINLLNKQLNMELTSSYQYLAMAVCCDNIGLSGAGHWMRKQSKEEMEHAEKFIEYLGDRQVFPVMQEIAKPQSPFSSLEDIFTTVLTLEKCVTESINDISTVALSEKDHTTYAFLQWFLLEQIEEEKSVQSVLDKLKLIANNSGLLYALDKELGSRG